MRFGRCRRTLAAVALLALATSAAMAVEDATELEPITVTAPVAPLDRSLYLLRLLVDRSAPCLGCDAVLRPRPAFPATVLDYLLAPADRIDEATRTARDVHLLDSPDLEYLRP